MKILVLGCNGQLGRCLKDQLVNTNYEVIFTSREQINITNFEEINSKILDISPDVIINAAAYTEVDMAEKDQNNANLINHLAVKNIADFCKKHGPWLIHISTDYVFDGNSNSPYKEHDQTNPHSAYGVTKLNGELAIQSSGCKYIIIRTAWVFSEYGNNFLKTMLRLGSKLDKLRVVDDQIGCPTYAQDLARSIVEIAPYLKMRSNNGIYHFCGNQPCTWHDFANAIFDHAVTKNLKIPNVINAIDTSSYPTPAKRPTFSVLNCSKIQNDFGIHPSNWLEGIEHSLDKLLFQKEI